MGTVIDERNDMKTWVMLAAPRHETANGATSSSLTFGSAGAAFGVGNVDTLGFDYVEYLFIKNTGTAAKTTLFLAESASAAGTFANATALTGGTLSAVTASGATYRFVEVNRPARKRYRVAKLTTSTTCGYSTLIAILRKGRVQPPGATRATTGWVSTTEVG